MLENEIYEWLKKSNIHTPEYKVFELNEIPEADFFPVALKIESAKVIHKSEVGGVATNLNNEEDLKIAKVSILSNLRMNGIQPDEKDKFIVSRMYSGIELFFGIVNDPVFERVIVFGTGGIFTELFQDVCFIDSEADEDEIINAIAQTKISALFIKGFRGKKYNINIILDFIKKLQKLDVKELDLNPVILQEDRLTVVDARLLENSTTFTTKKIKYLPEIFAPQKIVIIGVSSHSEKVGYALAKNASPHPGVLFVNPVLNNLFGKNVYKCIEDLPCLDTAIIALPAVLVKETIEKLITKQVKNIIIITAGFKEAGRDESFLTGLALEYKLNILGPNCLGMFTNGVNLTFGTGHIKKGQLNLFSQSGAIVAELMDKAAAKNIGFENIISVGNMSDVDFGDLINSYPGNNGINLYVEGIPNGKNLLRAIRKSRVPIKIFKAGQSEVARKAAFSHTGNLAGDYELFVGLLKSVGAKILKDVNGLLYTHTFEKVLIITNAGGAGTVMSDLISDKLYQLSAEEIQKLSEVLPTHWSKNNPIDIIGDAGYERYLSVLRTADNFDADVMYVIVTPQFMTEPEKISDIFLKEKFKTTIIPILLGGEMMDSAKLLLQRNKIEFFEELNEAASFL